jgi:hypothetical protein
MGAHTMSMTVKPDAFVLDRKTLWKRKERYVSLILSDDR